MGIAQPAMICWPIGYPGDNRLADGPKLGADLPWETMQAIEANEQRWGGILASVGKLDVWLHVAMVVLTAASAARYLTGHGLGGRGPVVLGGAVLLVAGFFASPTRFQSRSTTVTYGWCVVLIGCWMALVVLAPSFSWVAVPLAFVALRALPFAWASVAIIAMLATVVTAWSAMQNRLDPTVVTGPLAVAALAVIAYRALERESATRRELLDELRDAQVELAEAQHAAGALSERTRLSREIHDSVAQRLSSINLLLQAAEHRWTHQDNAARDYVRQASLTARDGLDEVRRVVHDLASADLLSDHNGSALSSALAHACDQISVDSEVKTQLQIHGNPIPVPPDTATALVRSARGALANVVEHSGATRATVSLTYQPDSVSLDVRDNGCGFSASKVDTSNGRGRGLAGIETRARLFGGHLTIESNPGDGTAVAVSIPVDRSP